MLPRSADLRSSMTYSCKTLLTNPAEASLRRGAILILLMQLVATAAFADAQGDCKRLMWQPGIAACTEWIRQEPNNPDAYDRRAARYLSWFGIQKDPAD